ncbi:hypothetical protein K227x_27870 [Rubripirellula lacrimiformis]|uniref:Uncharacterized protein n=1 Tax=Rubripirellula lacrimiformis TaxID=1930273 RepID=A0A517NB86_9BACT|nr:hypothetical protein [Rubripirellula lacrimiformis]QDT04396.1 hypothetical protein K227x_27870 [Rubripirellula lacrimiformis]
MDFWDNHSIWFVLFMFMFPRLTMLFATTFGGGVLYWIGWLFAPRFTVAVIATMLYGDTNIVMVVLAWLWALGGETTEKTVVSRRASRQS